MKQIEDLVLQIMRAIVNQPDAVEIHTSETTDEQGALTLVSVKVAKEDVGISIGKGGETAEAVRKIVGIAGFKSLEKRVYVRVDAPRLPSSHFTYN